jgi:uncharacterized repeat protein (TIGR02543 family)
MGIQYVDTSAIATIAVNTFTRVGYTFVGWNTAADGTGTSYANGAIYTMRDAADVTLYAQWVQVPTISAGGPLTFCVGENVVLTSSSATGNQWYKGGVLIADAINETYTATETGVYTVKVTKAGVESEASAGTSVTANSLPTASISNNTGTTALPCPTSAISVTATGGVSYAWDNGLGNVAMVRITTPGTYTVTVTSANGCEGSTSVAVTVNQSNVPAPIIVSIVQPRCQPFIDGKCGLSGLPAGNWTLMQLGTVAKTITGSGNTYTVDQLSDGVYRFVVIDQDGCPSPPTSPFGAIIKTY